MDSIILNLNLNPNYKKLPQVSGDTLAKADKNGSLVRYSTLPTDDTLLGSLLSGLANLALFNRTAFSYILFDSFDSNQLDSFLDLITNLLNEHKAFYLFNISGEFCSVFRTTYSGIPSIVIRANLSDRFQSTSPVCFCGHSSIFFHHTLYELNSPSPSSQADSWSDENTADGIPFEAMPAMTNVCAEDISELLCCDCLFPESLSHSSVSNLDVIQKLIDLQCVVAQPEGQYTITNLGALLFARKIADFPTVSRKAVHLSTYDWSATGGEYSDLIDSTGQMGYVAGFNGLIRRIMNALSKCSCPDNSDNSAPSVPPAYSEPCICQLVANALIHQDLLSADHSSISIYPDHIEFSNPGVPLIHPYHFFSHSFQHSPRTRNRILANAMQKLGLSSGLGNGYGEVIANVEQHKMPAPVITVFDQSTTVSLSYKIKFKDYSPYEKIFSCYAHVCLNYVNKFPSNNTTLRNRFDLDDKMRYMVSHVFSDTCNTKLIYEVENDSGPKYRTYLPYWAPEIELQEFTKRFNR